MKKIDRETAQRIIETADIVEVVSDFVTLKRRGSGYIGLCPFHADRTPSFSVSKSRNLCKCFSCGKGGSPVNFIMEHESMSYQEALRYLANKYGIEIHEEEVSEEERQRDQLRSSLLAANEFTLKHFESNLTDTDDGRDIGLSYFRQRGLSDAAIRKFHLGYALDRPTALLDAAVKAGYAVDRLVDTGLCIRNDAGRVYDRFKGRVIYPVFSLSGKVIAFGGRTLRKDVPAKYVNSPESIIYKKSNELYGLFQAKNAITRKDKCILVEGYMDVISMSQSGIENVVASSGTSLTEGQIRLIRRFTSNVTVIYDGDAAGIKASMRGIGMLLAEGLNIKVLLLPDGHDPDSFAQSRSSSQLEEYIDTREEDFIGFMTRVLMKDAKDDPIARARAVTEIVKTIALIPDPVTRNLYIVECSRQLMIDEGVVRLEVEKYFLENAEREHKAREREKAAATLSTDLTATSPADDTPAGDEVNERLAQQIGNGTPAVDAFMLPYEKLLLQLVLRYGMLDICDDVDEQGNTCRIKVVEYVDIELSRDDITFTDPGVRAAFNEALRLSRDEWPADFERNEAHLLQLRADEITAGQETLRTTAQSVDDIQRMEKQLIADADTRLAKARDQFAVTYIERSVCSSPDDVIRTLALELVPETHILSKYHTKYVHIPTDAERVAELVPRAIYELKDALLVGRLKSLTEQLRHTTDTDTILSLMNSQKEIMLLRSELAKYLGERTIVVRR